MDPIFQGMSMGQSWVLDAVLHSALEEADTPGGFVDPRIEGIYGAYPLPPIFEVLVMKNILGESWSFFFSEEFCRQGGILGHRFHRCCFFIGRSFPAYMHM